MRSGRAPRVRHDAFSVAAYAESRTAGVRGRTDVPLSAGAGACEAATSNASAAAGSRRWRERDSPEAKSESASHSRLRGIGNSTPSAMTSSCNTCRRALEHAKRTIEVNGSGPARGIVKRRHWKTIRSSRCRPGAREGKARATSGRPTRSRRGPRAHRSPELDVAAGPPPDVSTTGAVSVISRTGRDGSSPDPDEHGVDGADRGHATRAGTPRRFTDTKRSRPRWTARSSERLGAQASRRIHADRWAR